MAIIKQDYGSLGNDVQTQMLIAPVLAEMVSDRAYAVGEQFIVNNVLYKITQAVSGANVPLVVGTNCEVSDSITQQINSADVQHEFTPTMASGYTNISSMYTKLNSNMVWVKMTLEKTTEGIVSGDVAVMPSTLKPSVFCSCSFFGATGTYGWVQGSCAVTVDGNVRVTTSYNVKYLYISGIICKAPTS